MLDDVISDTHVSRPFLRKIKSDVINAHILGINHSENILLARDKSCVAKEGASSLEKVFNCYQATQIEKLESQNILTQVESQWSKRYLH